MYTAGTIAEIPANVMGSGRTLALHMYVLSCEGLHINQAYASSCVTSDRACDQRRIFIYRKTNYERVTNYG